MKCAIHPGVETNLSCGKCGQPICPRCLVHTPVGARCPNCARLKRLPIYEVSAAHYARAVGAGVIAGIIAGAVWALIPLGGFFWLILAAGLGYVVGEAVSLSVNRKRSVGLQVIGAGSVALAYVVSNTNLWNGAIVFNASHLLSVYGLIALAIGGLVAASRLR